jgi:hypothetical protein
VTYAQDNEKKGVFSNVPTVLPPSGLMGDHSETFSGSTSPSLASPLAARRPKWRDRLIIPVNMKSILRILRNTDQSELSYVWRAWLIDTIGTYVSQFVVLY